MLFLYLAACSWGGSDELPTAPDAKGPLPTLQLGKTTQVTRGPPPGADPQQPVGPEPVLTNESCDQLDDGGPVAGPECITAEITCGETVIGHTRGGTQSFDSKFYDKKFCTPATTNHDGGDERVYRLKMPAGDWTATAWLDTPCADLDLAGIEVSAGDTCPTMESAVPRCDMWPQGHGKRESIELTSQEPTTWLLVVEGKNDQEGPFGLHVTCRQGL